VNARALLLALPAVMTALGSSAGAQAKPLIAPELRLTFRFGAGSGLFARPGIGPDGSVYVGSGDGYVHALWADGSYRWSYTVKGRVAAAPLEEPNTRRVFVLTSEARLYALESDSRLRWVFSLPVAPKSEMALTPKGWLLFVGQDDHLYGVTTSGALVLRLAATGARSAPVLLADGKAGLVLGDTIATLKGYGYERAQLPGGFGPSASLALSADKAVFGCEGRRARSVGQPPLELESECLSPPVRGDGFFALAESTGAVRLLHDSGATTQLPIGASPLRPVWDAPRRRLILASATGSVAAYEMPPEAKR
jgi:hypothetical protein